MEWTIAQKNIYGSLKNFLIRHECGSVSFSARFKTLAQTFAGKTEKSVIVISKNPIDESIRAAVMITEHGLVLPVFDDVEGPEILPQQTLFSQMFFPYSEFLHSIMGTSRSVESTENLFGMKASDRIDYYLLSVAEEQYRKPVKKTKTNIKIVRAGVSDSRKLFPLQKEYEIEEVFLDPSRFSDRFCMYNLKATLRKQFVFYLESDGRVIAKAGTNAQGFSFDQIGGVFTAKEERGKGYSTLLLAHLVENILSRKKKACLFVKKNNTIAITLYKKLGFEHVDDFRISYYFNNLNR